ncbi:MAG: ATP phosphoribosyltransferase regulatory subunit, partial [Oscillospiraceae bacterium]|nr:ATP phosphoribosyltransferase regulatory subunit [Oscillospiraceae bacterium]
RTIDKFDKIGPEKTAELLKSDCALTDEQTERVTAFIGSTGDKASVLAALDSLRGRSATFDEGADELATLIGYMADFGVPDDHFAIDLTIARGLDYYTGTVYETTMWSHPEIGSICSGGRYDDLAGYYTDRKLPGVGISIGLTRLFYVLDEQGLLSDEVKTAPSDALVLPMTEDLSFALRAATALRGEGIRTQLYTEKKKMKAKMSYADRLGIPFVVFVGDDEIASGKLAVKDMTSGEQVSLEPGEAAGFIKKALAAGEGARCIKEK